MANVLTTYSGKDLSGSITNPVAGASIQLSGIAELGVAQVTVRMTTDQSSLQVGMDGAVVPSVIPGDNGEIDIQVWQTSTLQQQLLNLYNTLRSGRDLGIVAPWFGTTIYIKNTLDGSTHYATGCGFMKVPDKSYQEQAQRVSWVFKCANIVSEMNPSPLALATNLLTAI